MFEHKTAAGPPLCHTQAWQRSGGTVELTETFHYTTVTPRNNMTDEGGGRQRTK